MESEEIKWLKSVFREAEYDCDSPQPKRVKFSDVSDELQKHFPKEYSTRDSSLIIHEAFPNADSKRFGKARQTYLLGLERQPVASTFSPAATSSELVSDLHMQIELLKQRVAELEKAQEKSEETFCQQADNIIQRKSEVTMGPTTLEGFHHHDLQSIITELQGRAPDLYHLCMTIGDTKRNQKEDEVTTEEIKVMSSLCCLLNARSARMKGIQLLMGMMLVARGTSRQVILAINL